MPLRLLIFSCFCSTLFYIPSHLGYYSFLSSSHTSTSLSLSMLDSFDDIMDHLCHGCHTCATLCSLQILSPKVRSVKYTFKSIQLHDIGSILTQLNECCCLLIIHLSFHRCVILQQLYWIVNFLPEDEWSTLQANKNIGKNKKQKKQKNEEDKVRAEWMSFDRTLTYLLLTYFCVSSWLELDMTSR